ncbi:MAG: class B sortase [Clostridiales bacterium]|nr:class B sortase [uncultured Blautia sp.]MBS6195180.1 class B sortase [Clostridiales bacterium]
MKRLEKVSLVFCVMIFLICGKYLLDYWIDSYDNRQNYIQVEELAFPEKDDNNDETNESDQKSEDLQEEVFDYQALLEENADCIGWLSIDDTDISYPVVQGEDNEFYLHHDFYKKNAICGAIFLDYRNDVNRMQEHLILYGHQMKDGSMFKQLNGYKEKSFYEGHREITLFLGTQKYRYEVAAVYVTDLAKSGDYYNYVHKETRKQQMEYLLQMAAYQLYETEITVRENDELLSLSTCEYSSANGRLIVLARRTAE